MALRAALACLALLGLAAIPLATSASATPASCTTVANPLGAAQGWTEFIEGRNNRHSSESEGSVATGGVLTIQQVDIHGTNGNPATVRLVVGDKITNGGAPVKLEHGSAWVGNRAGSTPFFNNPPNPGAIEFHQSGSGYAASNPIDFAAAFTDLRAKSTAWATATTTGTVANLNPPAVPEGPLLGMTGTNSDLNVFNVTAAQLSSTQGVAIDVPMGSVALINVSGTSVTLGNGSAAKMWLKQGGTWKQASDSTIAAQPGILWNFPTATSVNFNGGGNWGGTYLAPNAAVSTSSSIGNNPGQIIAKTFDSEKETHLGLFPSSACLPGGGGPTPTPDADVQITKTASKASPGGGSTFSYSLTVKNNGPDKATAVKASDTLPLGVTFDWASTGCTVSGVIVTCDAGDLNNGDSKTFKIGVIANPIGAGGSVPHPGQQHNLTISKVESQVDLNPGETKTVQISCPSSGAILSDASIRVDAVDQGTGAMTDVHVVSAQSTGIASWEAVVTNGATGRAQAKAFAVCLPASTESAGGHQHSLIAANNVVSTTQAWGVGRQTATVACPSGTMPIVPGFAFAGGAATVAGSEPTAGGWKFTVDVSSPTTATLSVRCLNTDVDPAAGHTHALVTNHIVRTVNVPAGQTIEEQVICADDAKGIVGTWTLPAGVYSVGNDPRPKTRAFKLVNTTGSNQSATIDLECLNDRTGPEKVNGASPVSVLNTATVSTTATDSVNGNNSASATVTVQPDKVVALGASAKAGSTKLTVKAIASVSDNATITVKSPSGTVWATGSTNLTAGVAKTVQLDLTSDGQAALGSATKKGKGTIEVSAGSGTRWMTIKPA